MKLATPPETYTENLGFDYRDPDAPAVYLPSISQNYVVYGSRFQNGEIPEERIPAGLKNLPRALNFLDPNSGTWHYPYALTSAGHANLKIEVEGFDRNETMIQQRDRKVTTLMADSGGYQIGKGVLQFDWKNFESAENDALRLRILRWMEKTAELSMTLDVPVWGIGNERCGIKSFEDCLAKTMYNHEFFIKHRQHGATRLLNILHGRNQEECDRWWDTIKDLPFEGWAIGGVSTLDYELSLKRLICMRDGGYLDRTRDWIHVLGRSRFITGAAWSAIQRALRRTVLPSITISYDASSPFLSTAKGSVYSRLHYDPKRVSFGSGRFFDSKDLVGSTEPFPFLSPIGRRLTLGDINVRGHDFDSKSPFDTMSYIFIMNHNVYMHTRGIIETNALANLPAEIKKEYLPRSLIEFQDLITEIFASERPYDVIDSHRQFLARFNGIDAETIKSKTIDASSFFVFDSEPAAAETGLDGDQDLMEESCIIRD